jgi:hypothetical protein
MMGQMRSAHKILVRKPKGNRPLRRPKYRREDNIRTDLKKIGWECIWLRTGTCGGLF